MLISKNPFNGETVGEYAPLDANELEAALNDHASATERHHRRSVEERAEMLLALADQFESQKTALAELATREMGKPLRQAEAEVQKCADLCRFYAEHGPEWLRPEESANTPRFMVHHLPLGSILGVMPWNFPYWQVVRFAVPTLLAGNGVLIKHAPNVTGCALATEKLVLAAGFEAFKVLCISAETAGELIADPRVHGVSLTGSEGAGRAVATRAGAVLKPVVLELGGSDAFVVMQDADVKAAAHAATFARLQNNGQSCIAAKRFIVHHEVHEAFKSELVAAFAAQRLGNPLHAETDVGPLVSPEAVNRLQTQVDALLQAGASLAHQTKDLPEQGAFFPPTILEQVPKDHPAAREELFGPVAMLFSVKDENEAIHLANDTPFGLGCSLWTSDQAIISRFVNEVQSGSLSLNAATASRADVPFGGVKNSGLGREMGRDGLLAFVNRKAVGPL